MKATPSTGLKEEHQTNSSPVNWILDNLGQIEQSQNKIENLLTDDPGVKIFIFVAKFEIYQLPIWTLHMCHYFYSNPILFWTISLILLFMIGIKRKIVGGNFTEM